MSKIIISVPARVAKGIYIRPRVPGFLSREVRLTWDLTVECTFIRKTVGGKAFQREGTAYGKS